METKDVDLSGLTESQIQIILEIIALFKQLNRSE